MAKSFAHFNKFLEIRMVIVHLAARLASVSRAIGLASVSRAITLSKSNEPSGKGHLDHLIRQKKKCGHFLFKTTHVYDDLIVKLSHFRGIKHLITASWGTKLVMILASRGLTQGKKFCGHFSFKGASSDYSILFHDLLINTKNQNTFLKKCRWYLHLIVTYRGAKLKSKNMKFSFWIIRIENEYFSYKRLLTHLYALTSRQMMDK